MRAFEFYTNDDSTQIDEIQRTLSAKDPLSYKDRKIDQKTLSKIQMLPGDSRYGYTFDKSTSPFTDTTNQINLFDMKHPTDGIRFVGYLGLQDLSRLPFPNPYRVTNIGLDDEYRGTGLGQSLYGIALKLLHMTIIADDTQTPEARKAWVRLSQTPGVDVKGFAAIFSDSWDKRDTPSKIYDNDDLRLIRALKKVDGKEIGKDKMFAYISYPVGVDADRSELAALRKALNIYSARHPEEGGTDNGLFARWRG